MKVIMDQEMIRKSLVRISHEIIEKNNDLSNVILVGIKTRGEFLAKRIASNINKFEGKEIDVHVLDITAFRDDVDVETKKMIQNEYDMEVYDKHVILVDDVLFSGRTIRAAMDALMDIGRCRTIQFACLIDRGHRELPIRPDFVGKNIPTAYAEKVLVQVVEVDKIDQVSISKGE